jgi:hypothetical protein
MHARFVSGIFDRGKIITMTTLSEPKIQVGKNNSAAPAQGNSTMMWIWGAIVLVLMGFIAHHAQMGTLSPRVANPDVIGAPRPVEYLFGLGDSFWITFNEWGTVALMVTLFVMCVVGWRRRPGNPVVLMTLASTAIVWQDPIMNWAPFAVYNPALWHWPQDWPLINLSPTVEPFIVIGYAAFYFGPFFPAMSVLRKLQQGKSADAFVWRHPLITLALLIYVIGFFMDMMLEVTMIQTGLYIYSQVPPFGSIFVGTPFQFPLIWESSLVTLVMIPAGVLCYRDDTGRTQAEKLAQKLRMFDARPTLATFLVMFGILNIAYFMYGSGFAILKAGHFSTSVACPWPYPETKVYDPQGYYERESQVGPYFEGKWAAWASGMPNGRPASVERVPEGNCSSLQIK